MGFTGEPQDRGKEGNIYERENQSKQRDRERKAIREKQMGRGMGGSPKCRSG